jgi:hypothetical protein
VVVSSDKRAAALSEIVACAFIPNRVLRNPKNRARCYREFSWDNKSYKTIEEREACHKLSWRSDPALAKAASGRFAAEPANAQNSRPDVILLLAQSCGNPNRGQKKAHFRQGTER